MSERRETVAIWAIVDATGELVDAKTTRIAAFKRVELLGGWASYNNRKGHGPVAKAHAREVLAPFQVVRCVGEFVIGAPFPAAPPSEEPHPLAPKSAVAVCLHDPDYELETGQLVENGVVWRAQEVKP